MKTKVIVLGLEVVSVKNIEFISYLGENTTFTTTTTAKPSEWDAVELICKNYKGTGLDLMFAYDNNDRTDSCLFLGRFNNGTV